MTDKPPSLCNSCSGLEVWRGHVGPRYLCGRKLGEQPKAFGRFGRPCAKGLPQVAVCKTFSAGQHYSMRPR